MLAFIAAAAAPAAVVGFALSPSSMNARARAGSSLRMAAEGKQRVLVIGGTRFSGLYLTKELHSRGHEVGAVVAGLLLVRVCFRFVLFFAKDLHACAILNIRMQACYPRRERMWCRPSSLSLIAAHYCS